MKQLVILYPIFTVYKRQLIKIAKWIWEISPIFHISFLLCGGEYTKTKYTTNPLFQLSTSAATQEKWNPFKGKLFSYKKQYQTIGATKSKFNIVQNKTDKKRKMTIRNIFYISFLLCASKYTKPNIQRNHFFRILQKLSALQESNETSLQTFFFDLNVIVISIAFQIIIRKASNRWIFLLIFSWKKEINQTISQKP